MRVYEKTTQHPYCVYLTREEAVALLAESNDAVDSQYFGGFEKLPVLEKFISSLNAKVEAK